MRALLCMLLSCLWPVAALAGQAEFTVLNPSDTLRDECLCVSIPFAPGSVADETALARLTIRGVPTAWRVLTRYPDKSIMMAQAQGRLPLRPGERATLAIVPGKALAAAPAPAPMPAATPQVKLVWTDPEGQVLSAVTRADSVLEKTALRTVTRLRGVVVDPAGKEPLGLTVWLEDWRDNPHGYMDVMVACDSLDRPVPLVHFRELALEVKGLRVRPLWPQKEKGLKVKDSDDGTTVVLICDDFFADNQGKAYRLAYGPVGDEYVDRMAEAPLYPLATPETFKDRQQAIGILGCVPALPEGVSAQKAWDVLEGRWRAEYRSAKGPWDALGYACMPGPGATGDQADFGVLAMFRTYQTGHPGELTNVMPAMFRESCRINHFFGLDARALLAQKAVFWTERINERIWTGLGRDEKHWQAVYQSRHHGWSGYDEEHYSLNHLYEAWTLTGNWMLQAELALHQTHITLCYLNHFRYAGGLGNRTMGRVVHAALLAARATGDPWVVEAIVRKFHRHAVPRFEALKEKYAAAGLAAFAVWEGVADRRVPFEKIGSRDLVCNWQEGLIDWAVGQLPDKRIRQMAYEAGRCMCLNGFDQATGRLKTYYAAADPSRFESGGIASSWYYPSMRWAAAEAARRRDPAAERMQNAADAVLAGIRSGSLEGGAFAPWQRWTAVPEQ